MDFASIVIGIVVGMGTGVLTGIYSSFVSHRYFQFVQCRERIGQVFDKTIETWEEQFSLDANAPQSNYSLHEYIHKIESKHTDIYFNGLQLDALGHRASFRKVCKIYDEYSDFVTRLIELEECEPQVRPYEVYKIIFAECYKMKEESTYISPSIKSLLFGKIMFFEKPGKVIIKGKTANIR